jgi:uncharacterized damage-inducible protein DinB
MPTNLIISRPALEEYPEWVKGYIASVQSENLLEYLQASHDRNSSLALTLSEQQLNFRYQPDKWTIKEVLGHIIDTERIMAYRALRFARKDKTPLPGFDQDIFVENAHTQERDVQSIIREYAAVRQATLELFRSFDEETLTQSGTANDRQITVRALGYTIAGHETHHWNIIKERYL